MRAIHHCTDSSSVDKSLRRAPAASGADGRAAGSRARAVTSCALDGGFIYHLRNETVKTNVHAQGSRGLNKTSEMASIKKC